MVMLPPFHSTFHLNRVNLPRMRKNDPPFAQIIHAKETPMFSIDKGVSVKLISGQMHFGDAVHVGPGSSFAGSPLCLAHAFLSPSSQLNFAVPASASALVYIRRGSSSSRGNGDPSLSKYDLLRYEAGPSIDSSVPDKQFTLSSGEEGMDALILVGMPLEEPVVWSGPVVEATNESYLLSQRIFGAVADRNGFWSHKLSDEDWMLHTAQLGLQDLIKSIKGIK